MSSRIILVTGGSRSGKSKYAEDIYINKDDVLYIATAIVTDQDMEKRIEKHKERRNKSWTTLEGYKNLSYEITQSRQRYILLDCVTVMITNLMFDYTYDFDNILDSDIKNISKNIFLEFENILNAVNIQDKNIVFVTSEVGQGLVPEYRLGRIFRDIVGEINQYLARESQEVYLLSCGLPLQLK